MGKLTPANAGKILLTALSLGLPLFLLLTAWIPEHWPALGFDAVSIGATCVVLVWWAIRPFSLTVHWSLGAPALATAVGVVQIVLRTTVNSNATWLGTLDWMGLAGFYFLAQQLFAIEWNLRRYFPAAAIAFPVVYSVCAVVQWFTSQGRILWRFPNAIGADRVLGTILDRNHYSAWMELFLPVVFWYLLGSPRRNIHAGIATILLAVSMAVSGSGAGLLIGILELVAVLLLHHYWDVREHDDLAEGTLARGDGAEVRREFSRRRMTRRPVDAVEGIKTAATSLGGFLSGKSGRPFWLTGRAVAALFVLAAALEIAPMQERLLHSRVGGRLADHGPLRGQFKTASFRMIGARPLLGFGLGTWPEIYPAYRSSADDAPEMPAANHAYDDPLEWLAEGGLVFLLPVALLAVVCVQTGFDQPWALGPVGVLIHSLVDFPLREPVIFATMLLILAAGIERSRRSEWA